jgi:hypothetical protein
MEMATFPLRLLVATRAFLPTREPVDLVPHASERMPTVQADLFAKRIPATPISKWQMVAENLLPGMRENTDSPKLSES